LDGIERDGDPGLQTGDRGLQILKTAQLLDQFRTAGRCRAAGDAWPKRVHGMDQVLHPGICSLGVRHLSIRDQSTHGSRTRNGTARWRALSDQSISLNAVHNQSIPKGYDSIRRQPVRPKKSKDQQDFPSGPSIAQGSSLAGLLTLGTEGISRALFVGLVGLWRA
jgi:hypothetical protein